MDEDVIRIFKAAMVLCEISDKQIEKVLTKARDLYRRGITDALLSVLDAYYEKIDSGEIANLADMAREANVNAGSLRQAKMKYDKKRRQDAHATP